MKTLVVIGLAGFLAGAIGCRTDRPPKHLMVEMAFHKCDRCRSLQGGIYGKGPAKSFRSPEARTCVHLWGRIARDEFKKLGSQWHGVDWAAEIPFWSDGKE